MACCCPREPYPTYMYVFEVPSAEIIVIMMMMMMMMMMIMMMIIIIIIICYQRIHFIEEMCEVFHLWDPRSLYINVTGQI